MLGGLADRPPNSEVEGFGGWEIDQPLNFGGLADEPPNSEVEGWGLGTSVNLRMLGGEGRPTSEVGG